MSLFEVQKTGVVLPSRLKKEINDNGTIATVCNHVILNEPSDVRIWFQGTGPLPGAEETELDAVIGAHDATPPPPTEQKFNSDGHLIVKNAITTGGKVYQARFFQWTTALLESSYSRDIDDNDYEHTPGNPEISMKFYEDATEITGGNLNQSYLDKNCNITEVHMSFGFDFDIMSATLAIKEEVPNRTPVYCHMFPALAHLNMDAVMLSNMDASFMQKRTPMRFDGKVPKVVQGVAGIPAPHILMKIYHTPGLKLPFEGQLEMYK
jgi:hypothetical protein